MSMADVRDRLREARQRKAKEAARRRAICAACPHATGPTETMKIFCGRCGCPLAAKTRVPGATCPAGKW